MDGFLPESSHLLLCSGLRETLASVATEQRLSGGTNKGFLRGTHRTVPPAETLKKVQPMLRGLGVTRVANVTGLDTIGIPTVLVVRPNSRSLSVSQGKGLDLEAAKASGIMESVEQCHAETATPLLRFGSHGELSAQYPMVDVAGLPRYVRPFAPDTRLLWTPGTDLFTGATMLVPFDMVHLDMTLPLPPGSGFFPLGSNGLASGNSLAEAIIHGICELVERDAMALFRAMRPELQQTQRLCLDTIDDAASQELLGCYRSAGVRVAVWDVTSDAGIASFYCAIVEEQLDRLHRVGRACGFGCHLDRGVALCRALCEAAQSRLTRITGSRDDIPHADFHRLRSEAAILEHQVELEAAGSLGRSFQQVPTQSFPSFEQDLAWATERLSRVGVQQLVYVDLSPTSCPVSVVRVIVPGLEGAPDVPGYVPGRRARAVQGVHEP